jgi:hypothetical protein
MKYLNNLLACLGMTVVCFAAGHTAAYAGVAGHVQFVNGNVQIVDPAGQTRPAKKGDAINEGDTLASAIKSSAQIKMQDGGFVAVRPETRLKFDQFIFAGKEDGNEKSFFSLFKGGFRAVTGLIGRVNKQNYRITTPAATIGIRGTDHETVVVTPNGRNARSGTYNMVNTGETSMTTDRGTVNIKPGEGMAFSPGMNQAPVVMPVNTELFTASPPPSDQGRQGEAEQESQADNGGTNGEAQGATTEESTAAAEPEQGAETAAQEQGAGTTTQEQTEPIRETAVVDATPPAGGTAPAAAAPVATTTTAASTTVTVSQATSQSAPSTVATTGGFQLDTTTGTATDPTGQQTVVTQTGLVNAGLYAYEVVAATGAAGAYSIVNPWGEAMPNTAFALNTANALISADSLGFMDSFSGGTAQDVWKSADSSIYLGRWQGGVITTTDFGAPAGVSDLGVGSAHWIISSQTPLNYVQTLAGTATYALTAATAPTDAAGNVGVLLNTSAITANFTTQLVNIALDIQFTGKQFAVTTPGGIAIVGDAIWGPGAVACTGASCAAGGYTSNLWARLSGATASNVALAYHLMAGTADVIQGAAAFNTATAPTLATAVTYATEAQTVATAAQAAAVAAQNAYASVVSNDVTLAAIAQVPVAPAIAAIDTATVNVTSANTAVTAASALAAADAAAAAINATSIKTTTITATTQANAAQTALTANGVFADSTAGSANAIVQSANTALQTANTDVQAAAGTVTVQNAALVAAQNAASTALTSANTNLATANTGLITANTQNAAIASAQAATPAQVTAAQTAAANAQAAATAAQAAATQAAALQAAGDLLGAQAQLLIAQQEQAFAQQQLALAQSAQTTAANQLAAAQAAATAASTAVTAAEQTAILAGADAVTASTEAIAAQTAASSAAAALAQTDPAVVSPIPSAANLVQTNSATIVANAPIAAYNNPAVATIDRFVGIMSTVKADAGGGYVEGYGPGAGFTGIGTANTSFVLDGAGNLVESRHAWYEETAASTATPQIVVVDANVKRTGGVAAETFKMADNSIYAGRWVGGSITVSDNVVGIPPIPTFTRDLGVTSEHWAIMLAPTLGYVQTLGGSVTYSKAAGTSPTDALGNVGVLNTATLTANFTSQLVDAALNLTITGKTLNVFAAGMAITGSSFSTVTQATATCLGCIGTYYANVGGGFAGDAAATAGLNYTLWTGAAPGVTTGATDLIQGMVAFDTLTPPTVAPAQAFVQTDVSFELSAGNLYGSTPMYFGSNSMTAAGNVAPTALTPSFSWNYGCVDCGNYAVTLPGATGSVNGNATSFATTGIQFGRWTNVPTISEVSSSIAFGPGQNTVYGVSGWAFAPEGYLDTPTILSAATGGTTVGVFSYALNGAPAPKDSLGATGTLNSLSLTADFTTQTVTAALSVSLGATTWNASSAAPMSIGAFNGTNAGFGGNLNVTSTNTAAVNTYGYLSGAFTAQNYAGAIVDYTIQEWLQADGSMTAYISGVGALTRNGVAGNAAVANGGVPATGKFVVAEGGGYMWNIQTVDAATTTGGVLTSYAYNGGTGNSSTTTINCVTCTGQAALDTTTGIQFGTWDEGTRAYSYNTPFGGQFHWIQGPGLDPVYLPEVLLGSMSYTLDGGTAPTNQRGLTGTLSSAGLTVNFTNQTVDIALGLTGVNGHNWSATATGVPLSWTNYAKNAFWTSNGQITGALNVAMDGVSTGASGYLSGQLTGSGLNGSLFQYQLSAPTTLPVVPSTFTSADMVAVQAPSVTVTGPVITGGQVNVAFPVGATGTLAVQPATTLNLVLDSVTGQPTSATLAGGINASVTTLTADALKTGVYYGTAATGQTVAMDTYAWTYSARYSNFGEWRMFPTPAGLAPATATGPFSSGEFAGGMLMTPSVSMPVSNIGVSGGYSGSMVGGAQDLVTNTVYSLNGGVSLNAIFTTGALTGTVNNIQVLDRATGSYVGNFNDLSLTATIATNAFSGSVTANGVPVGATASPINVAAGTVGVTGGHFYGPSANELTGIWQLTNGSINASGAFGAGNGTSNTTAVETVNGTVALATATPADTATPYRSLAMSAYDPATSVGLMADGSFNNATRVTEVAGGVTAFDSGYNPNDIYSNSGSSRFAIGTATAAGLGTDPVTGISWGRWVGGSIDITNRTSGVVTPAALGTSSLHWIAAPSMTGPVALPVSGVYNYVLAGGTAPTDNLGNVGTLNSASLAANFTTQTVDVGVNVGISNAAGATTLIASGTGISIQQAAWFGAKTYAVAGGVNQLTASCAGAGCVTATPDAVISGAFTGVNGVGAAMTYGFNNGGTVVNGVAAFHR